jgi:prepilin-type N-terminal cleavage/methylation domain-containing protein
MLTYHTSHRVGRLGFTLIELLITVAIIAIIVGLALFALASAKGGANRTLALNGLRQTMVAYSGYTLEHNGRLLPGFVDSTILGTNPLTELDLKAKLPNGAVMAAGDTSGYVWRLAPYFDNGYVAFLADYTPGLRKRYQDEYVESAYGPATIAGDQLGIGYTPSIGYNSMYLGGDNVHGEGETPDYDPWNDVNPNIEESSMATVRMSEIQYPTRQIAFATAKAVNMSLPQVGEQLGYVELRPPFVPGSDPGSCDKPQWLIDEHNQLQPNTPYFSQPGGMMVDRNGGRKGDKVPTAQIDGSTTIVNPAEFIFDYPTPIHLTAVWEKTLARWSPNAARRYGAP